MSGPKCLDIEPDSRLRERRENQDKCESLSARYRRNFHEARALVARLAELKLAGTLTEDSPEVFEIEIRRQLAAGNDVQTVSNAMLRIQKLQKSVDSLKQHLETGIASLISRFSALSERINLVNARVGQLETAVSGSLPASWSPAARSEVEKVLRNTLAESRVPVCPAPSMNAASIAALEAAEIALASAETALARGAAQVSETMRSCHAAAVLDAVGGKGAPIERIEEEWLSAAGKPKDCDGTRD